MSDQDRECREGPLEDDVLQQALRNIQVDIAEGFEGMLSARGFNRDLNGAELTENEVFATSDHLVVVPWIYRCTHTGDFLGVPPTYVDLELRGTTFVHACASDPEEWDYYRYIDFIGALQQLGVTTTSRPALTEEEYGNWLERRPPSPAPG